MKFDESGLPPVKMVQDAFNRSYDVLMATQKEELGKFERQIIRMFRDNMTMLLIERKQGKMPEDVFEREKAQLEEIRKQQMAAGPKLIQNELNRQFVASHLRPALELFRNADKAAPEALVAVMLTESIRSPKDFRAIEKEYGPVVADIIADVGHIEAYPAERTKHLAAASDDAKRAYTALSIASLVNTAERADMFAKRGGGQRMIFPDGQEEHIFKNFQQVWGLDEKLQARMLEVFNIAAEKLLSGYRIEVDAGNTLQLVPFTPPKGPSQGNLPATKPKPPGGGSLGGDVF